MSLEITNSENSNIQIPPGFMADSKGRFVPVSNVREQDKLQDQMIATVLQHAKELSAQIGRFKGHTFDDVGAFMLILGEMYGAKKGGSKGNCTFTSFDGCSKLQIAVQDNLEFGPELQIAKGLIDECIADWSEGSSDKIRALVNHAFNVEKTGQVNREALFALRKIDIDDERWVRAQQAITDSMHIVGSKTYIRIYERKNPKDQWKAVTIDLAAA